MLAQLSNKRKGDIATNGGAIIRQLELSFLSKILYCYIYTEDIVRGRKRRCTEILSSYVNDFPPFHIGPETLFACKDKPAGWPA